MNNFFRKYGPTFGGIGAIVGVLSLIVTIYYNSNNSTLEENKILNAKSNQENGIYTDTIKIESQDKFGDQNDFKSLKDNKVIVESERNKEDKDITIGSGNNIDGILNTGDNNKIIQTKDTNTSK